MNQRFFRKFNLERLEHRAVLSVSLGGEDWHWPTDSHFDVGASAVLLGHMESVGAAETAANVDRHPAAAIKQLALDGPRITEFLASNSRAAGPAVTEQASPDWIEIENAGNEAVDLEGWYLTDDPQYLTKWSFPPTLVEPGGFLVVLASGCVGPSTKCQEGYLQTNFRLGHEEFLALVRPDGVTVVSRFDAADGSYPPQRNDVSFGLTTLGTSDDEPLDYYYMDAPSPGQPNNLGYRGLVEAARFSVERGFFGAADLEPGGALAGGVTLQSDTPGAQIYFTTNGSVPVVGSEGTFEYIAPIEVLTTTVIRATAYLQHYLPSDVVTSSYLFADDVASQSGEGLPELSAEDGIVDYVLDPRIFESDVWGSKLPAALTSLPTVSLTLDQQDIFGDQGLYANPWETGRTSERFASVEYIDPSNPARVFHANAGIRTHGWTNRSSPKQAFRIYFRAEYGTPRLEFPLYGGGGPVSTFQQLVLRSGNQDSFGRGSIESLYLRDQFSRQTQRDMGRDAANYQYVHLYINGLYWGLYDLSEHLDESFAAAHWGFSEDDFDVIKHGRGGLQFEAFHGTDDAWRSALALAGAGLQSPEAYSQIAQLIDISNLIDYSILEMYAGPFEWPQANWVAIRQRPDGRFRFYVWDDEVALRLNTRTIDLTGVSTPGTPGALYAALKENQEFRQLFADRIQLHFFNEGVLTPSAALARFERLANVVEPNMVPESARWGDSFAGRIGFGDPDDWLRQADQVRQLFLAERTATVLAQFKAAGLYPSIEPPDFTDSMPRPGQPSLLSFAPTPDGIYFTIDGSDPRLPGGAISPTAVLFTAPLELTESVTVLARTFDGATWSALETQAFAPPAVPADDTNLRISEVHYHPAAPTEAEKLAGYTDADDFEFLELVNVGTAPIDLRGVRFVQTGDAADPEGVAFDFATSSVKRLAPGERTLIVEDAGAFRLRYGSELRLAGHWQGGLSNNRETITLLAGDSVVHRFRYVDRWYPETDGGGRSLEAIEPALGDLQSWGLRQNWAPSSRVGGTPGYAGASPDFNHDGAVDALDIDVLFAQVASALHEDMYDLTGDRQVDQADVDQLLKSVLRTRAGDANLDGIFTSADLVTVFAYGQYENEGSHDSTWATGDWNGDGEFDSGDLVLAFQLGGYPTLSEADD